MCKWDVIQYTELSRKMFDVKILKLLLDFQFFVSRDISSKCLFLLHFKPATLISQIKPLLPFDIWLLIPSSSLFARKTNETILWM